MTSDSPSPSSSGSSISPPQQWQPNSLTETLGLVCLGTAATFSARYFRRKLMLRPFQLSVIVAITSSGVAVMQTVVDYSTPRTVKVLDASEDSSEASRHARLATSNLTLRLKHLAETSKQD